MTCKQLPNFQSIYVIAKAHLKVQISNIVPTGTSYTKHIIY